jgi:hypothetical protein
LNQTRKTSTTRIGPSVVSLSEKDDTGKKETLKMKERKGWAAERSSVDLHLNYPALAGLGALALDGVEEVEGEGGADGGGEDGGVVGVVRSRTSRSNSDTTLVQPRLQRRASAFALGGRMPLTPINRGPLAPTAGGRRFTPPSPRRSPGSPGGHSRNNALPHMRPLPLSPASPNGVVTSNSVKVLNLPHTDYKPVADKLEKRVIALEKEVADLGASLKTSNSERDERDAQLRDSHSQLDKRKAKLDESETVLAACQAQLEERTVQLQGSASKLEESHVMLDECYAKLTESETKRTQCHTQLIQCNTQMEQCHSELAVTNVRLEACQAKLDESEATLAATRTQLAEAKAKEQKNKDVIKKAKAILKRLNALPAR